jgi:2-polyprenyl-3-methyl-5-hydroxy-6-metoxy-1,4-benzoquinol methylase
MPHRWDDNAKLRKQQIESGLDLTFSEVFLPYYVRMVSRLAPRSILEVGGGTGHLARALASMTTKYVVLEPSQGMFAVASEVLDGTPAQLRQSTIEEFNGAENYDLILSHMCVQVVGNLAVFVNAVAKRLAPQAHFLLSLPHPVFYNATRVSFRGKNSGT